MLGRGRFALLNTGGFHRQRHSFSQSVRQGGILGRLSVCVGFPARVQHDLPLGGEAVTGTLCRNGGLCVPIGRTDRPKQGQRHQPQDLPFSQGQGGEVRGGGAPGRDNSVVVGHFLTVADLGGQHGSRRVQTADGSSGGDQGGDGILHIVRQKPAVRPGVGTQLLFIEGLEVVQGLLGGVAQGAVGLPLEGGEVVEGRGLFGLLPMFHFLNGDGAALAAGSNVAGLFLNVDPLPGQGHAAAVQLHGVERFRGKGGDLRLPLDDERQRGRDHAANVQRPAIENGEQAGGVDAHQPIRLGPAQGRLVQAVIVPAGTEVFKALPDGPVLHAGDPQPLHGLGASGQMVGGAEDQLPLPASVAGVHHLGHILPTQQGPQSVELALLVLADGKPPAVRQNG